MSERFDVIVVGSGAGGGLIAGELARRGRSVLCLEAGPHRTAKDFMRWEAQANHDIWFPIRMAMPPGGGEPVLLFGGRCVGGTTTVNTKVALRVHEQDVAKWHRASGLVGEGGEPFSLDDLAPHYERVESVLGIRERSDWSPTVRMFEKAFEAVGAELHPVMSYTDHNCTSIGSCMQGCPTNGGKSTENAYIAPALLTGNLELRAESPVSRVLIEDGVATGVEYVDPSGETRTVEGSAVVVAAGTLNSPQILLRSGVREASGGSPSSELIGKNLGFHPARLISGLFDEPQDAHRVYPITSHCMAHQLDEDGGFVVEAATVQDPIGFAAGLSDENGPFWGERLVEAVRQYRNWSGLLVMITDENHGTVSVDASGAESFTADFDEVERKRMDDGLQFCRQVLEAAGAKQVAWTGNVSTHVQGSCRMGSDPARSVVDGNCESHDVERLFVGDGSLVPKTMSVNPSMTIFALANRLADHLDADPKGYLGAPQGAMVSG